MLVNNCDMQNWLISPFLTMFERSLVVALSFRCNANKNKRTPPTTKRPWRAVALPLFLSMENSDYRDFKELPVAGGCLLVAVWASLRLLPCMTRALPWGSFLFLGASEKLVELTDDPRLSLRLLLTHFMSQEKLVKCKILKLSLLFTTG